MNEWLAANWFQVLTCVGIFGGWLIHYGVSKANRDAMSKKVGDLEDKFVGMDQRMTLHTTDSGIHVNQTLLQLFKERADYSKQQFADVRKDIERIENILTQR